METTAVSPPLKTSDRNRRPKQSARRLQSCSDRRKVARSSSSEVAVSRYGFWRPFITDAIYLYLDCDDLRCGFARVCYDRCGHEYLLPFSCKRRHFCPSCHRKRVVEYGEWLLTDVLKKVRHRHWVSDLCGWNRQQGAKLACTGSAVFHSGALSDLHAVVGSKGAGHRAAVEDGATGAIRPWSSMDEHQPHRSKYFQSTGIFILFIKVTPQGSNNQGHNKIIPYIQNVILPSLISLSNMVAIIA